MSVVFNSFSAIFFHFSLNWMLEQKLYLGSRLNLEIVFLNPKNINQLMTKFGLEHDDEESEEEMKDES